MSKQGLVENILWKKLSQQDLVARKYFLKKMSSKQDLVGRENILLEKKVVSKTFVGEKIFF